MTNTLWRSVLTKIHSFLLKEIVSRSSIRLNSFWKGWVLKNLLCLIGVNILVSCSWIITSWFLGIWILKRLKTWLMSRNFNLSCPLSWRNTLNTMSSVEWMPTLSLLPSARKSSCSLILQRSIPLWKRELPCKCRPPRLRSSSRRTKMRSWPHFPSKWSMWWKLTVRDHKRTHSCLLTSTPSTISSSSLLWKREDLNDPHLINF